MVELVNTQALGVCAARLGGSNPSARTDSIGEDKMTPDQKQSDGLKREFAITVPAAEVAQHFAARLKELKPKLRLNGFRPGKIPDDQIRAHFGPRIMDETMEELIQIQSAALFKEHKLRPALAPQVEVRTSREALLKGKSDLLCSLRVEITPEFTLTNLSALALERPVTSVDEKEVDLALEELARRSRRFAPADPARKAEKGDAIVIDYQGFDGDKPIKDASQKDRQAVLGEGVLPPDFEEKLIGTKAGETAEALLPPPPSNNPQKTPSATLFRFTLKAVHAPLPLPSGEDLARQTGAKNLAELRKILQTNLLESDKKAARVWIKRQIVDALLKTHANLPLPPSLIEQETQKLAQMAQERQTQIPPQAARQMAEERVRIRLILEEAARQGKVRVSPEELSRAAITQMRLFPTSSHTKLRAFYQTPEGVESLHAPLFEEKVIDYILAQASVSERKMDRESLHRGPNPASK